MPAPCTHPPAGRYWRIGDGKADLRESGCAEFAMGHGAGQSMHTQFDEFTPGSAFYKQQIAFLEHGDIDGLISTQYHEDAVIVGFDFAYRGHDALHRHFTSYLEQLGFIKLTSTDRFIEIEDAIFFEATMTTARGEARVYDVMMLRDGKITHHFAGVIAFTPLTQDPATTGT